MKPVYTILAAALTGVALVPAAQAQDGQLYEDVADPNSAYVRVLAADEKVAVIGDETFDDIEGGLTPYVVTPPGTVSITVGDDSLETDVAAASYYTYAVAADGTATLVQDKLSNSPAQADLTFYNLSDVPSVALFVPQAKTDALKDIAAGGSDTVALKAPLTLDFQVQDNGETLGQADGIALKRNSGVTIVFAGTAGDYKTWAVENRYVK